MERFPQPDLRPILGGYWLEVDYVYRWELEGVAYRLTVPAGLRPGIGTPWDGASVPWALTWVISTDGPHRAAALLHDLVYCTGGRVGNLHEQLDAAAPKPIWREVGQVWTREQADRLFLRVCREGGLPKWRRRLAFRALRWFGAAAWRG